MGIYFSIFRNLRKLYSSETDLVFRTFLKESEQGPHMGLTQIKTDSIRAVLISPLRCFIMSSCVEKFVDILNMITQVIVLVVIIALAIALYNVTSFIDRDCVMDLGKCCHDVCVQVGRAVQIHIDYPK
jgi:hypothetical protein